MNWNEFFQWAALFAVIFLALYRFPDYKGRLPRFLMILLWEESRKVCFGVLLVHVATWLLVKDLIGAEIWTGCAVMGAALVGGGTVADKFGGPLMQKVFAVFGRKEGKGDAPQPPAA